MSSKLQSEGASETEATSGVLSIVAGIPSNSTLENEGVVYYNMNSPSFWKRLLVFLRGLIYGFTSLLCCPVNLIKTDDHTWGRRLFVIGSMIGGAITGMLLGFLSSLLGCLIGREISSYAEDYNNRNTGCTVGHWTALALAICFMIVAVIRTLPKPIFQDTFPEATNNNDYTELKAIEEL